MARFEIKGDLGCFNSLQLEKIHNVLDDLKLKIEEVSIDCLGGAGDNFSSDVRVINVKICDEETFRIIVKSNLSAVLPKEMNIMTGVIFNNEITMYTDVLPMMSNLQEKAGVLKDNLMKYAKCYSTCREAEHEMIFLEDLTQKNYLMLNKFMPLSNEGIKVTLRYLASFHSLSYALKITDPVKYSEISKKLLDLNSLEGFQHILSQFILMGDKLSQMFNEEKYGRIMKQCITEYVTNDIKLTTSDYDSKYSVIIHGDSWTNNILFQLRENVPIDCIFIDYQQSRVSLPVADIFYLIFNCSDYETRKQHYYEWLDFYHSELEKNLSNFDLKIITVYPRDRFDSDLMRYAKSNLGRALITSIVLQRNHEESASVKEAIKSQDFNDVQDLFQLNSIQKASISIIKTKIEGLINSCIDFGYLNDM